MMPDHMFMTVEEEIDSVFAGRPHVVILGAGASLAAFPNGEASGVKLPVMANFVDTVGLEDVIAKLPGWSAARGFEENFSAMLSNSANAAAVRELEERIHAYFLAMQLPVGRTLYDDLLLSLREKDVVATFNWDPLLYAACARNHTRVKLPHMLYLHGSVAVGYCLEHRSTGSVLMNCSKCASPYKPTPLLYPVTQKDYTADPFIATQWEILTKVMRKAFMCTVFGYGAPSADEDAMRLLRNGWGPSVKREFEEFEIIDIRAEAELHETWEPFIHTHHRRIARTFRESWIGSHPRRSCEAMFSQVMDARFISSNTMPANLSLAELWDWMEPLLAAERLADSRGKGK